MKFTVGFSIILFLLNCQRINSETRDYDLTDNSILNEDFLWKSVVPFYAQEVLQKINTTDKYEEILFNKVSKTCVLDSTEWIAQLLQLDPVVNSWDFALIDAWGKPPSGILNQEWTRAALGDTDECLGVSVSANGRNFQGKYCLAQEQTKSQQASHANNFLPLFGSCIPSSCTTGDAVQLAFNVMSLLETGNALEFKVLDCFTSQKHSVEGWQTMFFVLGFLVLVSILAAIYESTARKKLNVREGWMRQISLSFSLKNNLRTWLSSDRETEISCLHGIRFFTVAWIILVHSWELPFIGYLSTWKSHANERGHDNTGWSALIITNGGVALDTLFAISGLTVTYSLMLELDKFHGKINVLVFYLRRLLRFTPTYAVVIGFMATLFPYFGSGPFSGITSHLAQNCEVNWWKNILYVNNFVNATVDNMCLIDSWYFATEMQFLILTPLVVFILWKYGRIGLGLLATLVLGSILTPGLLTFYGNEMPTAISNRDYYQYFEDIHVKPWIRASPYLVGILCGYFLHRGRKNKISTALIASCWLLSTALALAVIFVLVPYADPLEEIPKVESAIYAGLHRCAWGVIISWTVFACVNGYGGWINQFLSLKVFRPLSLLTVTAFLVSFPVQTVLHLRFRDFLFPDTYTKVNLFLADLVMTFFVASLLTIFVELPCLQIENAYIQRRTEDYVESHRSTYAQPQPQAERFGIYYNRDVSLCIEESKGRRRRAADSTIPPSRERYGIYYENNGSVSIDLFKKSKPSHR